MRYLFLSLLMVLQSSSFAVEKSDSLQQILNKVVDNKKVFVTAMGRRVFLKRALNGTKLISMTIQLSQ